MNTLGYIDISENAYEYDGFQKLGCRVFLSNDVWDKCVKWEKVDEEKQGYREQDTRLHDVLFVLNFHIESAFNNETIKNGWQYKLVCMIRDGVSKEAVHVYLEALPKQIEGEEWDLAIEYNGCSKIEEDN